MRKTSQDAGDNSSITSGIDNEMKKPGAGILKSTKNSIKRKVQGFSNESDDTANEPLLHKNKEKIEIEKQSAKFLISKTKTDFSSEKKDDKDKLLEDDKVTKPSISDVTGITTGVHMGNGFKEQKVSNFQSISTATIHNHMNTNVFNNSTRANNSGMPKTQILVELDASKPTGLSRSPLIFTTAKIHTDGKMQQMEPVQVTPAPILSTTEGSIVKTESKLFEKSNKTDNISEPNSSVAKDTKFTTLTSPTTQKASTSKVSEIHDKIVTAIRNVSSHSTNETIVKDTSFDTLNKTKTETTIKQIPSNSYNINNTVAQVPGTSKIQKDKTLSTKIPQVSSDNKSRIGNNPESIALVKSLPKTSETQSSSTKIDEQKSGLGLQTTLVGTSYVDINKNFQSQCPSDNKEISASKPVITNVTKTGSSTKENLEKPKLHTVITIKTKSETEKSSGKGRIELDSELSAKKGLEKSSVNLSTTYKTSTDTKNISEKLKTDFDSGSKFNNEGLEKSKGTSKISSDRKIIFDGTKQSTKDKSVDNNMIIKDDKFGKGVGAFNNITAVKTTESSLIPVSMSTRSTTDKVLAAPSPTAVKKETCPVTKGSGSPSSVITTSVVSNPTSTVVKNIKLTSKLNSATNVAPKNTTTKNSYVSSQIKPTTDITKTTSSDTKAVISNNATSVEKIAETEIESVKSSNTSQTKTPTTVIALTGNSTSKTSSITSANNVATVVSSIPKSAISALSTTAVTISNSKRAASPTVSNKLSAVKPSNVSQVSPDKTNLKSSTNPVHKSIPAISNNTKPAILSTVEKISTTSTSSRATTSSTLTGIAAKTATDGKLEPSENFKDTKGSKA